MSRGGSGSADLSLILCVRRVKYDSRIRDLEPPPVQLRLRVVTTPVSAENAGLVKNCDVRSILARHRYLVCKARARRGWLARLGRLKKARLQCLNIPLQHLRKHALVGPSFLSTTTTFRLFRTFKKLPILPRIIDPNFGRLRKGMHHHGPIMPSDTTMIQRSNNPTVYTRAGSSTPSHNEARVACYVIFCAHISYWSGVSYRSRGPAGELDVTIFDICGLMTVMNIHLAWR